MRGGLGGEQRSRCLIRLESKLGIDDEGRRGREQIVPHDPIDHWYTRTREKRGTDGDQGGTVFKPS